MLKAIAVDDNPVHLRELCSIISSFDLGIEIIETFQNGKSALEAIVKTQPDIVFADIMMPGTNGLELAKAIKKSNPSIKIVFVSSADDFNTVKSAIDLNMSEYILKPLKSSEVYKALTNVAGIIKRENEKSEELDMLMKTIGESKPLFTEQLFTDLLFAKANAETLEQRLELLNISHLKDKLVTISLIRINAKSSDIVNDYHIALSVKKFISKYNFDKLENYFIHHSINEFVIVSFFEKREKEAYKNALYNFYAEINNNINSLFNVGLNISFSSLSDNIFELNVLFKQANRAISNAFLKTDVPVIAYEDIENEDYIDKSIDFSELFSDVNNVIYSSDEEIECFIEKYFENVRLDHKDIKEYTKSLMYFIISILESILIKEKKSFNDIFDENLVLWKKLSDFESIIHYKNWLKNIFMAVKQSLKQEKMTDDTFVSKIKNFIAENYKENITLTDIADSVFYSVRQANYIFKNETGITIYDFLTEYRMEIAKNLIVTTNMKSKEISSSAGYASHPYFRLLFKKYTGMTISEYKKKYV